MECCCASGNSCAPVLSCQKHQLKGRVGRDSGDEQLAATAQLHAVSDAADQVLQHTASSLHGYLQGKHPRLSWLRQLASHLQADLRCSEQAHTALQRLCTHHLTRQLSNLQCALAWSCLCIAAPQGAVS